MIKENGKIVDFGLEVDLEEFREYFELAADLGVLEKYRSKIDGANDLESLRPLFQKLGSVFLPGYSSK